MKCHCGIECEIDVIPAESTLYVKNMNQYYCCPKHGFQGWVNTEGFEYLD